MNEDSEEEKFIPRNYQVELMKIALKQNTIIYLPTGAGKTFIAVLVLKRLSESLKKPFCEGGKITILTVKSVALVGQHTKYIKRHTIFDVGSYTGEMNLDFWSKDTWNVEFNKNQVFVMTSQILLDLILKSFLDLNRVNLLIFDECHRGVEDDPMRQIMRNFQNLTNPPRVLGLTATLLNGNCELKEVEEKIRSLETTYHAKVATVGGLEEVLNYSTNPKELFKIFQDYSLQAVDVLAIEELKKLLKNVSGINIKDVNKDETICLCNLKPLKPEDVLKKLRNLIKDLIEHINDLGTYGGYIATIAHMIQIERIRKYCENINLHIILNYVLTIFSCVKEILNNVMKDFTKTAKVYKFSSEKIIKLLEILEEYPKLSNEEICSLIFTQRRFTAKVLHHIICSLNDRFPNIKSNFIVGYSNNPYNDTRESLYISKKNKEVLNSFISKEINVLISSNILEEGIDIPKCTLVVKFDKSIEYRSYIQSKGRARHKDSIYYTLVNLSEKVKYFQKYFKFQKIEEEINKHLIGQNLKRSLPSNDEINKMYNEDLIKPFYTNGRNSAQINMLNSISLLCNYCNTLPSDKYTSYAPDWYIEEIDNKIRVVIIMPIICPILEPIYGPFMLTKKDAKRAAAMIACIKLYKCGEIDNNLIPRKNDINIDDVNHLFKHWPKDKDKRAGDKKIKRLHKKIIPKCLLLPIKDETLTYLHLINFDLSYKRDTDINLATLYDMYISDLSYGLITPLPIPNLCSFPLYNSQGTINVTIKENVQCFKLTSNELISIKKFHFMIFNDMLEVLKNFLILNNKDENIPHIFVVPINKKTLKINFDIVNSFQKLKDKTKRLTTNERININVNEESYLHKIVSPWYRAQAQMYIVTGVMLDKNPLSEFPNDEFDDFISYYDEKHGIKILNEQQPLLYVKSISNSLNFLKPKGIESKKKREKRYEELVEFLIPELVVKQDIPGCLWIQGKLLPSILSRFIYIINLAELQEKISIEANFNLNTNQIPLILDLHLLKYEPLIDNNNINDDGNNIEKQSENILLNDLLNKNKDFTNRMLEAQYPWKNIDEPKDIERVLDVTVMDIAHYEAFINQKVTNEEILIHKSPTRQQIPRITYPQKYIEKSLKLLKNKLNITPSLSQIYEALTTAEANDIVNLERLETLGDSFLKLIASLYIMFKYPKYNEGNATSLKGKLVSNKNLYYLAKQKNFGGIIKNCDLSPKEQWVPPSFSIPELFLNRILLKQELSINSLFYFTTLTYNEKINGIISIDNGNKIINDQYPPDDDEENSYTNMCQFVNSNYISDKSLADVVEAMLGSYFLSAGFNGAIKFVEWIDIIPETENLKKLIIQPPDNPILNKNIKIDDIDYHLPQWEKFEEIFGYHFNNRAFLLQALTHSSYSPNRITLSYEKLEFIGDAILDFLITCYIYENCNNLNPGQVTDLRSALVNNNTFASFVVREGYHKFLLMINSKLQGYIDKFANYLESKDYIIDDEVLILLEEKDMNIAEYVDVPKVLGDIFEALAGAVYLDSGKDLLTVWRVFYRIMWKEIDLFSKNVPINIIRRLYEYPNSYPRFSKAIQVSSTKTMVSLEFMNEGARKIVHGFGSNKTMAKRAAAKIALRSLN